MLQFLIGRVASAFLTVFGVVCVVFFLIHLVPGDPVEVMLGESALPAERQALRQLLGLDQPVLAQWRSYLAGLWHFDLGNSLHSRRAVTEILAEHAPATALLAVAALGVSITIAVPLGVLAALRKDTGWDYGAMAFSMLGVSIPNFWMGPLLILVFSLWLGWFPVSGDEGPAAIVLPALTLGSALAAILSRMIRSAVLEVLDEDYVRTARAKGLPEYQVIGRHVLGNAGLCVITVLGLQLGSLLAGAVITETVFDWPGIGHLTVEAIQKRDYPLVQGCVLLISLTYVVVNSLTDLAYGWLDPRIRFDR